jgi:hypothetical protein
MEARMTQLERQVAEVAGSVVTLTSQVTAVSVAQGAMSAEINGIRLQNAKHFEDVMSELVALRADIAGIKPMQRWYDRIAETFAQLLTKGIVYGLIVSTALYALGPKIKDAAITLVKSTTQH